MVAWPLPPNPRMASICRSVLLGGPFSVDVNLRGGADCGTSPGQRKNGAFSRAPFAQDQLSNIGGLGFDELADGVTKQLKV